MTRARFERTRVAVLGLVAVCVAAFVVTLLPGVRSGPGFRAAYDGWLQGGAYVVLALGSIVPLVLSRRERWFWSMIAVALSLRALGFVLYLTVVRGQHPAPYPSLADAAWLATSLVLVAAMAIGVARVAPGLQRTLALDAILVALTVAAVVVALLYPTLQARARHGLTLPALATNLAYPVLDVALLVVVAGLAVAVGFQTTAAARLLLVGILGFAVSHAVLAYEVTHDSFRIGTWLSGLLLVSTGLISAAPWFTPPEVDVARLRREPRHSSLAIPIGFAVVCVATFVFDTFNAVPSISLLLAASALLVAILRAWVTLVIDRTTSGQALQAKEDERVRFQALVEASGDFIAIAALDGTVMYVNPAGRRLVGLAPDVDVTTTTIADYLTEDGLERSVQVEQPAVIAEGHWEGESTLRNNRGGPPIPVAISSFLMYHPETGEPLALATVQRDITERLAASRALEDLADQRQMLLDRLVQAEANERARIAAEVHDDSVQALAVVDLRLGMLRSQLREAPPEQVRILSSAHDSVSHATDRLRQLLFDLESPASDVDLVSALSDAAGFLFDETGVTWSINGEKGMDLPQNVRVTAYRIAKEALANTLKHAEATHVDVAVAAGVDGGVSVTVCDDGRGYDVDGTSDRPGHLGLDGMHDRATVAGGRLETESVVGGGTTVRLWLPVPGSAA